MKIVFSILKTQTEGVKCQVCFLRLNNILISQPQISRSLQNSQNNNKNTLDISEFSILRQTAFYCLSV